MLFKITDVNTNDVFKYISLCSPHPSYIDKIELKLLKNQIIKVFRETIEVSFPFISYSGAPAMFDIFTDRDTYLATEIPSAKRKVEIEKYNQATKDSWHSLYNGSIMNNYIPNVIPTATATINYGDYAAANTTAATIGYAVNTTTATPATGIQYYATNQNTTANVTLNFPINYANYNFRINNNQ